MATEAYRRWVRAGRKWRACRPARELRELILSHAPDVHPTGLGMLGAEGSHLRDDSPADHTPFSFDAWPRPALGWVCALDVTHRPDLGLHAGKLANRLLADAKRGKAPWIKYLIWNGPHPIGLRGVRHGWRRQRAGGHHDHLHISFRSDHLDTSIGSYDPMEDDMPLSDGDVRKITNADVIPAPRVDQYGQKRPDEEVQRNATYQVDNYIRLIAEEQREMRGEMRELRERQATGGFTIAELSDAIADKLHARLRE